MTQICKIVLRLVDKSYSNPHTRPIHIMAKDFISGRPSDSRFIPAIALFPISKVLCFRSTESVNQDW